MIVRVLDAPLLYLAAAALFIAAARSRARHTGESFSVRSALICALTGFPALALLDDKSMLQAAVLIACLAVCVSTDLASGKIYDAVTIPAFGIIVGLDVCFGHLRGGIAGAASSAIVAGALYLATSRRGLGLGDVKLFVVIGAALTFVPSLTVIGAAFVIGAAIMGVALAIGRVRRHDRVPFAPYIAVASIGVMALRGMH